MRSFIASDCVVRALDCVIIIGLMAGCGANTEQAQPPAAPAVRSSAPPDSPPAEGAASLGSITGKVTLQGTPPAPKALTLDAACGKMHSGPVIDRDYLVGEAGGLANVLVYVKRGLEGKTYNPRMDPPVLDQLGCLYEPFVMGVMTNQPFKIRNSDPLLHNVHALPRKNREFNFGQPVKGQLNEKKFMLPEVFVRIKCDVHPWMVAYLGVVEHPFFAVTDREGKFALPPGLPPGQYALEASHPKAGVVTQEVTLEPGESKHVLMSLAVKSTP